MKNDVKISGRFTTNNYTDKFVEYKSEVDDMKKNYEPHCEVYKELCSLVGEQNMKKIHGQYRGISVQFPQSLYSKEYVRDFIKEHMLLMKPKDIALRFSITERRVRQIIKDIKERD